MDPEIIIGIGDLHGHMPALEAILNRCQAAYGIFSDREALLLRPGVKMVFTGDYIDRGEHNLPVIETIKSLQENPDAVTPLFGNHELLALSALGRATKIANQMADNSRYDLPWNERSWSDLLLGRYKSDNDHGPNGGTTFIQEFGPTPAQAFANYVQRMSRDGDIGGWLRSLKPLVVYKMSDRELLFVHGGIPSSLRDPMALESYLGAVQEHIDQRTGGESYTGRYLNNDLMGNHSIFWDRSMPRSDGQSAIDAVRRLDVDHIVIGHTPQKGITCFGGAVFDIDVGMTPKYGEGEPACIVFKENGVFALYARKGEQRLVEWA